MVRYIYGTVMKCSSAKTVSIRIESRRAHPIYGKIQKRFTKVMIHDPKEQCKVGDYVKAQSCAPVSKMKSNLFVEVIS